ncbi:exopolysaccharide transport family protein [Chelatococcus sp. SYSU_G07232]|uniref:Exopolysaccharide transport family protein n=1 Tax=Chelatococcus albus TaxID=3047466 RepID=A0ABT7AC22_9HYPH|nr:exopolysaccharide transport family protein [Chelatococcus sp. SYSU_G07232]MDJ1156913.1 exopolysaccharide transport family protein [Chelatococcus sp. SYSU_G07232]
MARSISSDFPAGAGDALDIGQVWNALRASRWWIALPTCLALVGSVVAVNLVTPRYTGETRVLLENRDSFYTRPDPSEREVQGIDSEAVLSQVQILTSRDLAREVIRRTGLVGNPEFDPQATGLGTVGRLLALVGLGGARGAAPEERVLTQFFDRLLVFPVGKSRVVQIEFTSRDPDLAARVANSISEVYLEFQRAAKQEAARNASGWLASNIDQLRKRVAEAESKVETFRAEKGLLASGNNSTLPAQQLSELSSQLASARAAQADAQAKAQLIREMMRSGRTFEIPDVANNDLIRRLIEQRVSLRSQLALDLRTLLPEHPRIKELNAQLADLETQMRAAAERTVRALENDARLAGSRVDSLLSALETQKKVAAEANENEVQLRALEREARTQREQLETYLAKYREARARDVENASPADARVVSRAVPPSSPSFPKKVPIILVSTLATLFLSAALVVARELLSGRAFVTPAQATSWPAETVAEPVASEPELLRSDPEAVATARALDAILAKLAVRPEPERGARVLVTETDAGDGAASMASALAHHVANRARTVLVAVASEDDGGTATPGFIDLVAGRASFAEVIGRERGARLHVIPAGSGDATTLGEAVDTVDLALSALDQTYQWVVCVLPASHRNALASLLAARVDGVILASRDEDTSGTTLATFAELEASGARNMIVAVANDGVPPPSSEAAA